ncbi:hypothetical protein BC829DRAFT_412950 [Chytridium lagenaria]|nr:hypothetical protein BC829DRAFT_412950 [Chytridium lagenaria]
MTASDSVLFHEAVPFFIRTDAKAINEKRRQHLLVNRLLEQCRDHGRDENPKFLAQLTSHVQADTVLFSIIETNSFKHITHISLKLIRGNDSSVKLHLASLIKQYKDRLDTTTKTLSVQLDTGIPLVIISVIGLERLKISYAEQASRLELQFSKKLASEKDQIITERELLKRKLDEEKYNIQRSYEDKLGVLSDKYEKLLSSNGRLKSDFEALQFQLENEQKMVNAYTDDLRMAKMELEALRRTTRESESKLDEMERDKKEMLASNSSLEMALREKTDSVSSQQSKISRLEDERAKSEQTLEYCQSRISTLEASFQAASEEIAKSSKSKIKLKNVVTMQQEKLLDERSNMITVQQEELQTLKESNSKLSKEGTDLKAQVDELQRKVEEGKQIIAENTQVLSGFISS